MKYGSVCSGIEAATVAWEPLGWEPVFFSEIEPFPRAVLANHYPNVPCHGDFTTIKRNDYAVIDVLVGGTPCQSWSLAGLRGGMDDPRGQLSLEFGKLAARLRPQWLLWENVPGVFSSGGGRDFAGFLGLLTGKRIEVPRDGWGNSGVVQGIASAYSIAWRVLDAQFCGVPQRRRRVFVVGCLGADWRRPLAVLLERHSLSGDSPPRQEKGKGTSSCFETGPGSYHSSEVSPTLDTRTKNGPMQNQVGMAIVGHAEYSASHHPLPSSEGGDCGGGSEGLIVMSTGQGGADSFGDFCTTLTCNHEAPILFETATSGGWPPDVAPTLDASFGDKQGLDDQHINGGAGLFTPIVVKTSNTKANGDTVNGQAVVQNPIAFEQNQRDEIRDLHGISDMMKSHEGMKHRTYLAYSVDEECNANEELHGPLLRGGEGGTRKTIVQVPDREEALNFQSSQSGLRENETVGTLDANYGSRRHNGVFLGSHVRRLTPKEASRLQGFPDDFAKIPWKGKPADQCPDGPQYKAYGNSFAVPVVRWIGERIQMVHEILMRGEK